MNRIIKFRGKRVDNGEWVYGSLCILDSDLYFIRPINKSNQSQWEKVLPETVGQFTGLNDKNGKEIYEGDYLTITENEFKYGEGPVLFKNASFYVNDMYLYDIHWENLLPEITGNIHDND